MDRFARLVRDGKITAAEARRRREQSRISAAVPVGRSARRNNNGPARIATINTGLNRSNIARINMDPTTHTLTINVTEIYRTIDFVAIPDMPIGPVTNVVRLSPLKMTHLRPYVHYQRYRFKKLEVVWQPVVAGTTGGCMALAIGTTGVGMNLPEIASVDGSVYGPIGVPRTCVANLATRGDDWADIDDDGQLGSRTLTYWFKASEPGPAGMLSVSYIIELNDPVADRMSRNDERRDSTTSVVPRGEESRQNKLDCLVNEYSEEELLMALGLLHTRRFPLSGSSSGDAAPHQEGGGGSGPPGTNTPVTGQEANSDDTAAGVART